MKPFNAADSSTLPFKPLPIRASHSIDLDFYTDTRNIVRIWLPESYGEDECFSCILKEVEDRKFFVDGDKLVTTYTKEGWYNIIGEVTPGEDSVRLSLSVTNISNKIIRPSRASVCIQFASAPCFADSQLERYFYVVDSKVNYFKLPFDKLDANQFWPFTSSDLAKHLAQNPPPDYPFIGIESKDKEWVVGHAWDSSKYIWGNCHPSFSCIHSDPMFDTIEPGQTSMANGVLFLMRGTPEQCVERYKNEFMNNFD